MGWDDCASGEGVFKGWCGLFVAQDLCRSGMGQSLCIYIYESGLQSSVYRMVTFRSLWEVLESGGAGAQLMISQEFMRSTCTALGPCHKRWQDGTRRGVAAEAQEICPGKLLSWGQSCCSSAICQSPHCAGPVNVLGMCLFTHTSSGLNAQRGELLPKVWAAEPSRDGEQPSLQKSSIHLFYSLPVAVSSWVCFHPLVEQVRWLQGLAVHWDLVRNSEGKQFLLQSTKLGHSYAVLTKKWE